MKSNEFLKNYIKDRLILLNKFKSQKNYDNCIVKNIINFKKEIMITRENVDVECNIIENDILSCIEHSGSCTITNGSYYKELSKYATSIFFINTSETHNFIIYNNFDVYEKDKNIYINLDIDINIGNKQHVQIIKNCNYYEDDTMGFRTFPTINLLQQMVEQCGRYKKDAFFVIKSRDLQYIRSLTEYSDYFDYEKFTFYNENIVEVE